jgi:hypothetical protein
MTTAAAMMNITSSSDVLVQQTKISSPPYVSLSDPDDEQQHHHHHHPSNNNAGNTTSDDRYYVKIDSDNYDASSSSLSSEQNKNQGRMEIILFGIHIMIVIVLAIIYIPSMMKKQQQQELDSSSSSNPIDTDEQVNGDFFTLFLPWYFMMTAGLAIVLVFLSNLCFIDNSSAGKIVLTGSILLNIIGFLCYFITSLHNHHVGLTVFLYYCLFGHARANRSDRPSLQSRIPYISRMVEISTTTTTSSNHSISFQSTLLFYSVVYLFIQYAWIALWMIVLYSFNFATMDNTMSIGTALGAFLAMFLFVLFSLFWTSNVIGTILYVYNITCIYIYISLSCHSLSLIESLPLLLWSLVLLFYFHFTILDA